VNIPVVVCGLLFERTGRSEAIVQARLEAVDLLGIV
jgi:hypothetical protein